MDAFIRFLIVFWVSVFQCSVKVLTANGPATKCSDVGPDVCYPFRIRNQHPQYQTHSYFELVCRNNLTIIHFPSYGNLVVKSIAYDLKKVDLVDPKNCAHQVFMNLNLSLTPFHYYYVLKNYTYLNCSTSVSHRFMEVPCLSGPNHHVYTVDPSLSVPNSCKAVKTAAIPFEYNPYLSGNTLGLGLTWDLPESDTKIPKETRDSHTARRTVVTVSMAVLCTFAVATVIIATVRRRKTARNWYEKEGHLLERLADL